MYERDRQTDGQTDRQTPHDGKRISRQKFGRWLYLHLISGMQATRYLNLNDFLTAYKSFDVYDCV